MNWKQWLFQSESNHNQKSQALTDAYAAFSEQHPDWAASLFDEHFLTHRAGPILERYQAGCASAAPRELAEAWAEQMWLEADRRQRYVNELTPVAADFLQLLDAELPVRAEARQIAVSGVGD